MKTTKKSSNFKTIESNLDANIDVKEEPVFQPLSSIINDEDENINIISPVKSKRTIILEDEVEYKESKFTIINIIL